jgi:hypothetical protein
MYIRLAFTLIGVYPVVLLVVFGGGHAVAQPRVERDGQPDADSGRATPAAARTVGMEGDGSVSAIVFIHGGLTEFPEAALRRHLTANPVITRFLAAGYAVVMATFRTYEKDVQSRGPIEDVRAVVRATARLPGVEPRRIPLYGGSGGGDDRWGKGADERVVADVVRDVRGFLDRAMPAVPAEEER